MGVDHKTGSISWDKKIFKRFKAYALENSVNRSLLVNRIVDQYLRGKGY